MIKRFFYRGLYLTADQAAAAYIAAIIAFIIFSQTVDYESVNIVLLGIGWVLGWSLTVWMREEHDEHKNDSP